MQTTHARTIEVVDVEKVECNRCGRDMGSYGLHADVGGGYESTALADLTSYKFDLCEPCLAWLFSTFKLPVTVDANEGSDYEKFEVARLNALGRGETPPKYDDWARVHRTPNVE